MQELEMEWKISKHQLANLPYGHVDTPPNAGPCVLALVCLLRNINAESKKKKKISNHVLVFQQVCLLV